MFETYNQLGYDSKKSYNRGLRKICTVLLIFIECLRKKFQVKFCYKTACYSLCFLGFVTHEHNF